MAGQIGPDGIALSIVRAAGTHRVTCEQILNACTPQGVRPGFRVLIREGIRDRRCEIVGDDEYDRRAAGGTARPRAEILTELAPQAGDGASTSGAASHASVPTPTTPLTMQESADLAQLEKEAAAQGSRLFSTAAAVNCLIGVGGDLAKRNKGLDRIKALVHKGAVSYNESTERVLLLSAAPVASHVEPAKGSTMAMPDLDNFARTGKVHPLRVLQAAAAFYGLRSPEEALNPPLGNMKAQEAQGLALHLLFLDEILGLSYGKLVVMFHMNLALVNRARSAATTRIDGNPALARRVRELIAELIAQPNPEVAAAPPVPEPEPERKPVPAATPTPVAALGPAPEPEPETVRVPTPAPAPAPRAPTPEPAPARSVAASAGVRFSHQDREPASLQLVPVAEELVAVRPTAASMPAPRAHAHGSKVFAPLAGDLEPLTIPYNPHDPTVTVDRVIAVVARVCDVSETALRSSKRGSPQESHARFLIMVILYWMLEKSDAQIAVELGGRKEGGVAQSRSVFERALRNDDLEGRRRLRAVLTELGAAQPVAAAPAPATTVLSSRALQVSVPERDSPLLVDANPLVTPDMVVAAVARAWNADRASLTARDRGPSEIADARRAAMLLQYVVCSAEDEAIGPYFRRQVDQVQGMREQASRMAKEDAAFSAKLIAAFEALLAMLVEEPEPETEPQPEPAPAAGPALPAEGRSAEQAAAPIAAEPPPVMERGRRIESGRLPQILALPPRLAEGFRDPLIAAIEETGVNAAKLLRGEPLPDGVTAETIYRDLCTIAGTVPLVVDGIARGKDKT